MASIAFVLAYEEATGRRVHGSTHSQRCCATVTSYLQAEGIDVTKLFSRRLTRS